MDFSSPSSSCLWNFPGKNTWVGCHFHLQGTFLIQGSNLLSVTWQALFKASEDAGRRRSRRGPSRRTASSTTPVSVRSGHCNKDAADWNAQQQTSISCSSGSPKVQNPGADTQCLAVSSNSQERGHLFSPRGSDLICGCTTLMTQVLQETLPPVSPR